MTPRRVLAAVQAAALALALAACTTPPRDPDGASVSGRLSVKVDAWQDQPARSVSAGFDLNGSPQQGQLSLTSPLGTVVARAEWSATGVKLTSSDGETRYDSLDTLTRDMLGESLPVAALFDWLRGRPWPGAPAEPRTGAGEAGFVQLGWSVQLERLGEGWVVAQRVAPPQVTVRARVEP